MKITKRQLKRIIKEERQKILNEMWGQTAEPLSPLVEFGQAWAGLGGAIQEQMIDVVNAYIENRVEDVYEINPNALDKAMERLRRPLNSLGQSNPDAEEVAEALDWAKGIFDEGDAEVEADRLAGLGKGD